MQEDESWIPPANRPDQREKMRMIECLAKSATRLVMNNHFYSFDNEIRIQQKGGTIGNKATARVGKLLMKRHAREYSSLLKELRIESEMLTGY